MTNNEPQFPRDESQYCQTCGQHLLALHVNEECPTERYAENYKSREQGRHDHRSPIDLWLAMKDDER